MNLHISRDNHRSLPRLQRLAALAATIVAGLAACGALLAALAGPALPVSAAAVTAPASVTANYPGSAPCDTSLQACIEGLSAGDTIVVQPGTYVTAALTLNKAVNLTGVSSGTVILQALANQRVLTITSAAVNSSVVISGLTFAGGHAVGADCPDGCGGAILITGTAQPLLANLTISNNQSDAFGAGVYAFAGSPLVLSGLTVISNTSQNYGGGLYTMQSVTITSSLFFDNHCPGVQCGGAAARVGGSLTANDTQFISNTGSLYGALLVSGNTVMSGSTLLDNHGSASGALFGTGTTILTNTTVLSNSASIMGGAIYSFGNITLSGGLYQSNQCACFGGVLATHNNLFVNGTHFLNNAAGSGGVANVNGQAFVTGGVFENNQSGGIGGALKVFTGAAITDTQFLSNTSVDLGGALYSQGPVVLLGVLFQNNQCTNVNCQGGALDADSSLQLSGTQILSNSSGNKGGGVFVYGQSTIIYSLFQNNHSGGNGGGLYAMNSSTVSATQFLSNISVGDGAGLYYTGGDARLANNLFAGNTAGGRGDALGLASPGTAAVLFTTIASPTVGGGSAIYVTQGSVGITDTLIASDTVGIEVSGGNVFEDYNLFAGVTTPYSPTQGIGPHSHIGAAVFVGPNGDDYHLRSTSAAWHIGTYVGVNVDFDGDPRPTYGGFDIGFDQVLETIPVAVADAYNPAKNATLTVAAPGVLANDYDADLDALTAILGQAPAAGTLDLAASGAFTYTPPLDFAGVVTFTYQADDGLFSSTPAVVSITVGDLPLSGLAAHSSSPTLLGSSTSFTASLNAGSHITYTWSFGDGGPVLIGPSALVSHTYSATGSYQVVVTATNTLGHLTAMINAIVNDLPVAANDFYTTTKSAPFVVAAAGVLQNDSDVYPGTLTAQLATSPASGTLVLASTGAFTYTPPLGFTGVVTFTYRASDALLVSAPATVRLTINPFRLYLPLARR